MSGTAEEDDLAATAGAESEKAADPDEGLAGVCAGANWAGDESIFDRLVICMIRTCDSNFDLLHIAYRQ